MFLETPSVLLVQFVPQGSFSLLLVLLMWIPNAALASHAVHRSICLLRVQAPAMLFALT